MLMMVSVLQVLSVGMRKSLSLVWLLMMMSVLQGLVLWEWWRVCWSALMERRWRRRLHTARWRATTGCTSRARKRPPTPLVSCGLLVASGWYLYTWKSRYALHPISYCLWKSSGVGLIDDSPLVSFKEECLALPLSMPLSSRTAGGVVSSDKLCRILPGQWLSLKVVNPLGPRPATILSLWNPMWREVTQKVKKILR